MSNARNPDIPYYISYYTSVYISTGLFIGFVVCILLFSNFHSSNPLCVDWCFIYNLIMIIFLIITQMINQYIGTFSMKCTLSLYLKSHLSQMQWYWIWLTKSNQFQDIFSKRRRIQKLRQFIERPKKLEFWREKIKKRRETVCLWEPSSRFPPAIGRWYWFIITINII